VKDLMSEGRIDLISDAVSILSRRHDDIPVVASITGPVSTAASVVDPMTFLKELRREKDLAHRFLDYVSEFLIAYALRLVESGASVIAIADPTATGEILGPKFFGEYAVRYINRITDAVHRTGTPVIVHICGQLDAVKGLIPSLHSDAVSTDALVNLEKLKAEFPGIVTMGNLSTYLLESGTSAKVEENAARLVSSGVDIIAPACGLSTSSPLANIQAFTSAVREFNA
jgi:[methyl-Co(III) methanol-specific corrinoid protein]:coenzyme M methyltransferase